MLPLMLIRFALVILWVTTSLVGEEASADRVAWSKFSEAVVTVAVRPYSSATTCR